MILILLGTKTFEFRRPLIDVEKLCQKGVINDKIIVQSGYTEYSSKYFEMIPFMKSEQLNELIDNATIVISHAGTGSVLGALKRNKRVIAIARYQELNEHIDNHQIDLINEFAKMNYLIPWYKEDDLGVLIEKVKIFSPTPYVSNKEFILDYIYNYIINI